APDPAVKTTVSILRPANNSVEQTACTSLAKDSGTVAQSAVDRGQIRSTPTRHSRRLVDPCCRTPTSRPLDGTARDANTAESVCLSTLGAGRLSVAFRPGADSGRRPVGKPRHPGYGGTRSALRKPSRRHHG